MNDKICDLHVHSTFSDGTQTPEQVISTAKAAGLSAVALTDHNTALGLERFCAAADGIEAVCGIELTTDHEGTELHLLGLMLFRDVWDDVNEYTAERARLKKEANRECIERIRRDGYDVSYEEFSRIFGTENKNRAHIAMYLMQKGLCESVSAGFDTFVSKSGKYFVDTPKFDIFEAIKKVHEWGAAAVLAHPIISVGREKAAELLPRLYAAGLDGTETYYSGYTNDDHLYMQRLASSIGLLESGGSDFHADAKPNIKMFSYDGMSMPMECLEKLKELVKYKYSNK